MSCVADNANARLARLHILQVDHFYRHLLVRLPVQPASRSAHKLRSCYCSRVRLQQCDAPSVYITKGSPANALQALIALGINPRHCLPLALSRVCSGHPLSVAALHPPWTLS